MAARPLLMTLVASLVACSAEAGGQVPLRLTPIKGLDEFLEIPDDNPLTLAKVELGRRLFFDPLLSRDKTISCAGCHQPRIAFADSVAVSHGVEGRRGSRNAPALINRAYGTSFFWDGRASVLEAQVLRPISDPDEMDLPLAEAVARLRGDTAYASSFDATFGGGPSEVGLARALASYVRTIRSGGSAVDAYRAGERSALTPEAVRGATLFSGKANCSACHRGPNFTDERFHNTGVTTRSSDVGRYALTGVYSDWGAFKTPTLRDLTLTAPYMHDGSIPTLEDVVDFYDGGGGPNPNLSNDIRPLHLTGAEKRDLIAFLRALESEEVTCAPVLCVPPMASLVSAPLAAQRRDPISVEHVVEVKDTAAHLFHVTTTFSGLSQDRLDMSLPIWTPGWYTLQYYGKNIRAFSVHDGAGRRLPAPLSRTQTWSIDTRGVDRIVVEFDYFADVLALNSAKITNTFAFFTGTQLFLEPMGHRSAPALVRFVVPQGWGTVSALQDTAEPDVYTAPDYDTLVDAPTWLGAFQLHRFEAGRKPYILVLPAEAHFPADSVRRHTERLANMVETTSAIFGGLPYDKYVHFWLPGEPEGADGALEHGNSVVVCCGGPTRLGVNRYTAHEFFHAWNVKRIRPAELWPYDYSRPIDTPSLWVSEGVSEYYGSLIAYRAGFQTDTAFVASLASTIFSYERNPERHNVSLSDASFATWRAYLREPVSYYSGGNIVGALLDLAILRDTRGARGLDEVMRRLYSGFFEQDRGFTSDDLIAVVGEVAGRDYRDFFSRYVTGVEVPSYDSIFGYAGIRTEASAEPSGLLRMTSVVVPGGRLIDRILTDSPAEQAGLRIGDLITSIDNVPIGQVNFLLPNGCCLPLERAAEPVLVTAQRGSTIVEARVSLAPYRGMLIDVHFDAAASAEQMAVRNAWLARP